MSPETYQPGGDHSREYQHECAFLRLYGHTVLGRVLSGKVCDLDRAGGHYEVCHSLTNAKIHAWAFAWGMAFGLSKPEWAAQVLSEFHPDWQKPLGEGQWPIQIEQAVQENPAEGHL